MLFNSRQISGLKRSCSPRVWAASSAAASVAALSAHFSNASRAPPANEEGSTATRFIQRPSLGASVARGKRRWPSEVLFFVLHLGQRVSHRASHRDTSRRHVCLVPPLVLGG